MGGMQEEPGGVKTKTEMNDGNDSGVPGRWRAVGAGLTRSFTAAAVGRTCVRAFVFLSFVIFFGFLK